MAESRWQRGLRGRKCAGPQSCLHREKVAAVSAIPPRTLKSIALGFALLLVHFVANAQESFSGEFQLKAKAHIEGLTLAPDYRIVVEGGSATVKFTKDGKAQEERGGIMVTVLSGIDLTTKRPAKFSGFLRTTVIKSGWARDKFVTRIEIPIEPTGATRKVPSSPDPEPILGFASTASVDRQSLDVLPNGISRYSDPMGIRKHSDYTVEVIKNPIK